MLTIYDRYAGMLFGYLFEIVKDRELAEQYMVSIFKSVANQPDEFTNSDNTWRCLQQLAKVKLADFYSTLQDCDNHAITYLNNGLINLMNDAQRNIFCGVYYHGKTTADLAKQLNEPELTIRKTLKEAFAIIRQRREY